MKTSIPTKTTLPGGSHSGALEMGSDTCMRWHSPPPHLWQGAPPGCRSGGTMVLASTECLRTPGHSLGFGELGQ